jgi:hypothetical protein
MTFEDAGRAVDRELTNLKQWVDRKLDPSSRREMAAALRKAAERLAKLAERLEKPDR